MTQLRNQGPYLVDDTLENVQQVYLSLIYNKLQYPTPTLIINKLFLILLFNRLLVDASSNTMKNTMFKKCCSCPSVTV